MKKYILAYILTISIFVITMFGVGKLTNESVTEDRVLDHSYQPVNCTRTYQEDSLPPKFRSGNKMLNFGQNRVHRKAMHLDY